MSLTVEYVKEPSWCDETENDVAECIVKFAEIAEELPFTAVEGDSEAHTADVLAMIRSGEAGAVKSFAEYKAARDAELAEANAAEFADLKSKILALNPSANLPTDADLNADGNTTLEEMRQYLDLLKQQQLQAKFG